MDSRAAATGGRSTTRGADVERRAGPEESPGGTPEGPPALAPRPRHVTLSPEQLDRLLTPPEIDPAADEEGEPYSALPPG